MPSECASIEDSPGPTDHLYNAGTGSHQGEMLTLRLGAQTESVMPTKGLRHGEPSTASPR